MSSTSLEQIFSLCGTIVLPCWLLLVFAPRWRWTYRLSTFAAPLLIAAIYVWLLATAPHAPGGGFGSLAQVRALFTVDKALLAGWIHYLAFDLFTGAWEARDAQRSGISHWLVVPCLLLTFLFGPLGLALYLLLKAIARRRYGALVEEA